MRSKHLALIAIFALGVTFGSQAGKNDRVSPDMFRDKSPEQAAATLLDMALRQAGKGSWERIAVGRMYYLSGDEDRGQEIFDSITKKEAGDWIRIGRVYWQADHWDRAREAFDQVVRMKPGDEDWLAEIGAYYNLKGDRAKAEEFFDRSFKSEPESLYNTLKAAGSYLGVEER